MWYTVGHFHQSNTSAENNLIDILMNYGVIHHDIRKLSDQIQMRLKDIWIQSTMSEIIQILKPVFMSMHFASKADSNYRREITQSDYQAESSA